MKQATKPPFVMRGERSMRRIARQFRAECRGLGIKPTVWKRAP